MKNTILFTLLILLSFTFAFSQEKARDYVVLMKGDTLKGEIKSKIVFTGLKILRIKTPEGKKRILKTEIKKMYLNNESYYNEILLMEGYTKVYSFSVFRKEKNLLYKGDLLDVINLPNGSKKLNKKTVVIVNKKHILPLGFYKYYLNDYPKTQGFIDTYKSKGEVPEDSLIAFAKAYEVFKSENPKSQSFAEKNIHTKKLFQPIVGIGLNMIIQPEAYFGVEIGVANSITVTPKVLYRGITLLQPDKEKVLLVFSSFASLDIRYYYNNKKKKEKHNLSTYKNSGVFASVEYLAPLKERIEKDNYSYVVDDFLALSVGIKGVAFSDFFMEIKMGAYLDLLPTDEVEFEGLLYKIGVGYSF